MATDKLPDNVDLRLLGTNVRALQRQMAILQAGQAQLPTLDQFQAGLSAIDEQFTALGDVIAEKVTAALGDHLTTIAARLDALERRP
jgi:hypothetical protein